MKTIAMINYDPPENYRFVLKKKNFDGAVPGRHDYHYELHLLTDGEGHEFIQDVYRLTSECVNAAAKEALTMLQQTTINDIIDNDGGIVVTHRNKNCWTDYKWKEL